MMTKKMVTLGLLAVLSSSNAFARTGTETSGGGDAVVINNELVIRDLVQHEQLQRIDDNVAFLDKVPNFRALINDLMKVNPGFAAKIINSLVEARIYISPKELPLLPYTQTTITGIAADVQLATRNGGDLLIAPAFFQSKQQEYIMIHEALHTILIDNSGPFHHQRVRTIVKYLFDNRNALNADKLNSVLVKNNYPNNSDIYDQKIAVYMDRSIDPLVRCSKIVYNTYAQSLMEYEKLNCDEYDISYSKQFVEKRFPGIVEKVRGLSYFSISELNKRASVISLDKYGPFDFTQKRIQKYSCNSSIWSIRDFKKLKDKVENALDLAVEINKLVEDANLAPVEIATVDSVTELYYSGLYSKEKTNIEREKFLRDSLKKLQQDVDLLQGQEKRCRELYDDLLK